MLNMTNTFLRWMYSTNAGDLERIEFNILVENWRYFSDPGRKNLKNLIRRF